MDSNYTRRGTQKDEGFHYGWTFTRILLLLLSRRKQFFSTGTSVSLEGASHSGREFGRQPPSQMRKQV
jgi:hypothetical protein